MLKPIRRLVSLRRTATLIGIFTVLTAGIAFAEETAAPGPDLKKLSIEELMNLEVRTVYSASKYDQKMMEAPSSVTIITSSDIRKYGYRTLADTLRSVMSFYITNDRNYTYLGVRGFGRPGDYNGRILLLIDGHRTNDNIYDQAFIGTEGVIDVDLIDRVEVVRGPASSLYGSNAFFAVVNVITKRGGDLQGTEISGETASYNTFKGRISYGSRFSNGYDAIVSGTGYDSKGAESYFREFDPAFSTDPRAGNGGMTNDTDYDRYRSFFTKELAGDLAFEAAYNSRTKGIPTGAFGTDFNNSGNRTTDGHTYGDLKYSRNLGGQTDLSARLYYDDYWYEGDYIADGVTQKDLGNGDWWGSEVKVSSRFFDVHRVTVGMEYTGNLRQDQKNYDVDPFSLNLDDKRRSRILAAYAQDEFSPSRNTIVNAGVRYDHYSTFGGTTNPRLAFIFTPTMKSAIKLLYGSAFRTPNVFELYYSTPPINLSNPDLKPEKIKTYELVYEQDLAEGLRLTVSGYLYRIKDLINQVDTGAGTRFENVDAVNARGAELALMKRWSGGAEGRFSYTLQRAEDKLSGKPLTNSPAQLAKLNFSAPLVKEKVFAGFEEQYTSSRRTEAGGTAEGFFITNLTLFARNPANRVEISVSAYNLLNEKYDDPVSEDLLPLDTVQQEGRTFRLKVTYLF